MTSARRLFLKRLRAAQAAASATRLEASRAPKPATPNGENGSREQERSGSLTSSRPSSSAPDTEGQRALRRAATQGSLGVQETTETSSSAGSGLASLTRRGSRYAALLSSSRRHKSSRSAPTPEGDASSEGGGGQPAAMCSNVRRAPDVPANASDYEQISSKTPYLGHVRLSALSYSNKQMVKSHHKWATDKGRRGGGAGTPASSTVMLVENRDTSLPFYYVLLRMNSRSFWLTIVGVQFLLTLACSVVFALAGQRPGTAVALALDVNGLGVGDIECEAAFSTKWGALSRDGTATCRTWAALFSLFHAVLLLFAGGVIVVRLSRVVAKRRFEFSKNAILVKNEELCIRFFSNRPSTVVMPSFRLEYFNTRGRARPLTLVNGGGIAYLHDSCLYLRHKVDEHSPFSLPDWRDEVVKVRIAVMGFDELLAQDVSGTAIYYTKDILDDAKYDDVLFRARLRIPESERTEKKRANAGARSITDERDDDTKLALIADMSRLDELVYLEEDDDDDDANRASKAGAPPDGGETTVPPHHHAGHSVAQVDAGLSEGEVERRVRRAQTANIHRPGALTRGLSIAQMVVLPRPDDAPHDDDDDQRTVDVEQPRSSNASDDENTNTNTNTVEEEEENKASTASQKENDDVIKHTTHRALEVIKRVASKDDEAEEKVIELRDLPYSDRQWIRSLLHSSTMPNYMVTLVTNRRRPIPWHYVFLRMRTTHFWWSIVVVTAVVTALGGLGFAAVAGQTPANAVLLSLDVHHLSVGDVECEPDAWGAFDHVGVPLCRGVGAVVRVVFFVIELFFGAMIIVRLSRVVVQCRFKFSDFCVLTRDFHTGQKELVVRIVSNRPSTLIMPTFQLEYMDAAGKRLHPLDLTNGGSTAYLSDSTFFLRHRVDRSSPFYGDDWRSTVLGVRVAVMGFDDLLAQEACGCRYYLTEHIRDDVDYGDMVSTATVSYKRTRHNAYVVDMKKLNLAVPLTQRSSSRTLSTRGSSTTASSGATSAGGPPPPSARRPPREVVVVEPPPPPVDDVLGADDDDDAAFADAFDELATDASPSFSAPEGTTTIRDDGAVGDRPPPPYTLFEAEPTEAPIVVGPRGPSAVDLCV